MKRSKEKRKLKGLWYKKDIIGWINQKYKMKIYTKGMTSEDNIFNIDMAIWNTRYTHEEITSTHYEGWEPYCTSDKPCQSSAMERMRKTEDGWYCRHCYTKLGKHLLNIGKIKVISLRQEFNNEQGRPYAFLEGFNINGI